MVQSKDDLENCRFLPHRILEKVMEPMQSKGIKKLNKDRSYCKISLIGLQQRKQGHCPVSNHLYSWGRVYCFALRNAVYSHNWDELLSLLRAAPVWEHNRKRHGFKDSYYIYFDNYFKEAMPAFLFLASFQCNVPPVSEHLHVVGFNIFKDVCLRRFIKYNTIIAMQKLGILTLQKVLPSGAFTILLMNHPAAKSQNLLQEYLHMVQSCRSDEDKRALTKLLAALPERLVSRNSYAAKTNWLMELYEKRGESY